VTGALLLFLDEQAAIERAIAKKNEYLEPAPKSPPPEAVTGTFQGVIEV